jgi:hypothetical protein
MRMPGGPEDLGVEGDRGRFCRVSCSRFTSETVMNLPCYVGRISNACKAVVLSGGVCMRAALLTGPRGMGHDARI